MTLPFFKIHAENNFNIILTLSRYKTLFRSTYKRVFCVTCQVKIFDPHLNSLWNPLLDVLGPPRFVTRRGGVIGAPKTTFFFKESHEPRLKMHVYIFSHSSHERVDS